MATVVYCSVDAFGERMAERRGTPARTAV